MNKIIEILRNKAELGIFPPLREHAMRLIAEEIHTLYTTEISESKLLIPTIRRDEAVYFCEPYHEAKHREPLKGKEMLLKWALSKPAKGVDNNLLKACECFLNLEPIWMPQTENVKPEHYGEMQALVAARDLLKEAVESNKSAKGDEDSETPIDEFRKHIANELTRVELIDRLCETTQLYRDLRDQYLARPDRANGVGDVAIAALKKIANPIQYLQEEAEKEGAKLDGYMAIQLIKDANFYQEIARKALKELNN